MYIRQFSAEIEKKIRHRFISDSKKYGANITLITIGNQTEWMFFKTV